MLVIRLRRKGKKNQPFFRLIVVDKRKTAKGGRAVEILGNVDPLTEKRHFKKDRILYWISKGAKPSATVHNMLVTEKIIEAKKINVSKKPKKADEASVAAVPAAEVKPVEAPVGAPKESEAKVEEKPADTPVPAEPAVPAQSTPQAKQEEAKPEAPAEESKPAE